MANGNGNGNLPKVDSMWSALVYIGNKFGLIALLFVGFSAVFITGFWLLVGKPFAEDRTQIQKDRAMLLEQVQDNLIRSTVAQELTAKAMGEISSAIAALKRQDDSFVASVNVQHVEQLKMAADTLNEMKAAHETMRPVMEERKLQTKLLTEIRDAVQNKE